MTWLSLFSRAEGRTILALVLVASAFALKSVQPEWARDMFVFGMALLAREMGVDDSRRDRGGGYGAQSA